MLNDSVITAPVTVSDVKQCLSENTYNVGKLCTSNNINKWAKYKPVRYNKTSGITDQERYYVNYGLDPGSAYSLDISEIATKAEAGTSWDYLKPRSGQDWFRLGDFRGYNHKAQSMINYHWIPSVIKTIGTTADIELRFLYNDDAELKLSDFIWFEDNGGLANYHFAVAYYQSTNDVRFAHGPALTTTGDIIIPMTLPLGTWKCMFIATQETGEYTDAQPSVLIPEGSFSINVQREVRHAIVTILNDYSNIFLDSSGIYGIYFPNLSVKAHDKSVPESTGRFYVSIKCYDSESNILAQFDVIDESNADFTYSGTETAEYTLDFNAGGAIEFNVWAPELDGSQVERAEIDAVVTTISGDGVFGLKQRYLWTARRQ